MERQSKIPAVRFDDVTPDIYICPYMYQTQNNKQEHANKTQREGAQRFTVGPSKDFAAHNLPDAASISF